MDSNILQGGIKEIEDIRRQVVELDERREKNAELQKQKKHIEKNISKKEKEIADEIDGLIDHRRKQVEATFDEQLNDLDERINTLESRKEKARKRAMTQRIDSETADFRSEDEELKLTAKSAFKEENIPRLYNNRLFFALYFPNSLGDIAIIILTLALAFFVIPFGIYSLFFEGSGSVYLALSYVGVIIVFGGIYLLVNKTKYKHLDALNRVREMRRKIKENKKKQKKIERTIKKDTDESSYDLEEFDQEIADYKNSMAELLEKKKEALVEFDSTTASEIRRQVTEDHEEELTSLRSQYEEVAKEEKENLEKLNDLSVKISTDYEGIMGKEFLQVEKLDAMKKTIEDGRAKNIEEAMDIY